MIFHDLVLTGGAVLDLKYPIYVTAQLRVVRDADDRRALYPRPST